MKTEQMIEQIDMGQCLIRLGVGMNNNGDEIVSTEWLREVEIEWDFCRPSGPDEFEHIRQAHKNEWGHERDVINTDLTDWLVFGRDMKDGNGILTGELDYYAAYIG